MIWRLTLECGHLRLDGPWDDNEPHRMIGDITGCDLCPRQVTGEARTMMLRQVVGVEPVPANRYREPAEELARARAEALREEAWRP